MDKKTKRLFTFFFTLKAICALMMSLLVVYYWGVSDNISFFAESKNFAKQVAADISNLKYFWLPVDVYRENLAANSSVGIESNFLVIKITTLLYPFAFGRFLIINFLFCILALVGQFKFYLALSQRYSHMKKNIAVAVLLMPSVLLYSSYINKETLCMAFIGFSVYTFFQITHNKNRGINTILLLFNLFLIAVLKIYVIAAFFGAVAIVYFIKLVLHFWKGSIISKIFIAIFLSLALWAFVSNLSVFDPFIVEFADTSNTFQQQYNSQEASSAFEFGEVETSFSGLLQKSPLAVYTTFFRPQLWEVNKPIILFIALEAFLVLVITFWALIARRKNIRPLLKNDLWANVSFYYVILFGMVVGLTTFNFGSLVRYKIPAVPFLMVFVFLLLHYRPNKNEVSKEEITD
ncbi:MAG: hypothetical protein ABIT58_05395 [Ferruginibacter sp.]